MLESIMLLNIWLNYSGRKNHVALKNVDHLFCMASQLLESDKLLLFLLSDSTGMDDNEYLESL